MSAGVPHGVRRLTNAEGTFESTENFIRGELHGTYAARTDGSLRTRRPRLGRDVGGYRVEGRFADGEPHGRWLWTYDGGSNERHYTQGELHGVEVETLADGERREREYVAGERHRGTWSREEDGRVVVSVEYAAGELTALSLPVARLPEMAPPDPGFSAIEGAFGVRLGTDLEQFRGLRCREFVRAYVAEGPEQPCLEWIAGGLLDGYDISSGVITNPPTPVSGAHAHVVRVSWYAGVEKLLVVMPASFGPDNRTELDAEASRLDGLLEGKYGTECRTAPSWSEEVETRRGQCDVRGLLARRVYTSRYWVSVLNGVEVEIRRADAGIVVVYMADSAEELDESARRVEAIEAAAHREPLQADDL